jgi:hypothetical protein
MEGPNMPFYFFCLMLGILLGALVTWFLLAEHPFESREAPGGPVDPLETGVLADQMKAAGTELSEEAIAKVLELHGAYVVGAREDRIATEASAPPPAPVDTESAEQPTA